MYDRVAELPLRQILAEALSLHVLVVREVEQVVAYLEVEAEVVHERDVIDVRVRRREGLEQADR